MKSDQEKGKEFEDEVARTYRVMGYEVKQNVGILGHQIDIIASYRIPGDIETKVAVQCKYVSEGNLHKNDAMDNINALYDLRNSREVHHLAIVTTNGFAKDLWDTARDKEIELLLYLELEDRTFNVDKYLDRIITDYEAEELSEYYVEPRGEDKSGEPPVLYEIVTDFIYEWLEKERSNILTVLGEYGTGKTSLCKNIAYTIARRYRDEIPDTRIPVVIRLSENGGILNMREQITDLFVNRYGIKTVDYPLIEDLMKRGKLLLIFDGLDEVPQSDSIDRAVSNYNRVAELAKFINNKIIITCRTEYFKTYAEEKEVLTESNMGSGSAILNITDFKMAQIEEFLKKRVPLLENEKREKRGWEYYLRTIERIEGLDELARRPVLLNLIVCCLPRLAEKKEIITANSIYDATIKEEIKRKLTPGGKVIEASDRLRLLEVLACYLYTRGTISIYYEEIVDSVNIKAYFGLEKTQEVKRYLHDFLTCSFLTRDAEGNYGFSHKSFLDYFTAIKLQKDIQTGVPYDFGRGRLSKEALEFLNNMAVDSSTLHRWIKEPEPAKPTEVPYLGGNAVSLLNKKGLGIKEYDLSDTILLNADFSGLDLTGVKFSNSNLGSANFSGCVLENVDFTNADLGNVFINEPQGINAIAWSPDGRYIAAGIGMLNGFNSLVIIEPENNRHIKLVLTEGPILNLCWDTTGSYLGGISFDKVCVWDLENLNSEVKKLPPIQGSSYIMGVGKDDFYRIYRGKISFSESVFAVADGDRKIIEEFVNKYQKNSRNPRGLNDKDRALPVEILDSFNKPPSSIVFDSTPDLFYRDEYDLVLLSSAGRFPVILNSINDQPVIKWLLAVGVDHTRSKLATGDFTTTLRLWDVEPGSKHFGACTKIIDLKMNCKGMITDGVVGLDTRVYRNLNGESKITTLNTFFEECKTAYAK